MIGAFSQQHVVFVFTVECNGSRAYNSADGKELWSFRAGCGASCFHPSILCGGKHYILVGAGATTQVISRGNNIMPLLPQLHRVWAF